MVTAYSPQDFLQQLFMEPVEELSPDEYLIKTYGKQGFEGEKLRQILRLFPEADITITFDPDPGDTILNEYRLYLYTNPDKAASDTLFCPFLYDYWQPEGAFYWYQHRELFHEKRFGAPGLVGRLIMPRHFLTKYVRQAYHTLDSSLGQRICRHFMSVNHNLPEEYEKELEATFAKLREQGISELISIPDTCNHCYPGAEAWKFYTPDGRFQFRIVIHDQEENCFVIHKCENQCQPSTDPDMPF